MDASATLPDHVLNDVKSSLNLTKDVITIAITNERPNVALSVSDLCFLIPIDANCPEDIPVTIIYCNQQNTSEICADHTRDWAIEQGIDSGCIAYYHALICEKQKHDLKHLLGKGEVHILFSTTALGMAMWGLALTFCGFVQEAGRAARDLETEGEAILIVPKSVMKEKVTDLNLNEEIGVAAAEGEALNRPMNDTEYGTVEYALDNEGIRLEELDIFEIMEPNRPAAPATKSKQKCFRKNTSFCETQALLLYIQTKNCCHIIWNWFFNNAQKLGLVYGVTSMYKKKDGARCCDICQPHLFPIPHISSTSTCSG
ncbi:LOW QUALITY PROTEIN: hypothetical protein CVT25_009249 [Psilocybe cyanescens]|uniref:DNA 3'-5' helicase n=1 Tax=Psilocybe cyanescens TaxID=93625 RepID=A0A409XTP1_PSICY|nr:LOW QUALITY PROTEIN: hypothetical protein CVT25_009249 [Psilocybe cyanescens]